MTQPSVFALCYVSSATDKFERPDIEGLLQQSRERNAASDVTGLLLYCDGNFMQYLEGMQPSVEAIWDSIRRDPRHSDVTSLFQEPVAERLFENWSMAFGDTEPPELAHLMRRLEDREQPPPGGYSPTLIGRLLQNFWTLAWSRTSAGF